MDRHLIARRAAWLVPSLACVIAASVHLGAGAQQAATSKAPDMSGSYERYRGAPGARGAQTRDPYSPPPASQPPLKPSYLKEWQAKQQAVREAEAKGEPLGSNVTYCIPDGMPGMMGGPFPMEILQSTGQVTIIQEAYNQVRRILLDQPQKPIDDVDPGFYGRSVGHWEGDTLVVDTIGVKESVRYHDRRSGHAGEAVDVYARLQTDAGLHAARVHLRRQSRVHGREGDPAVPARLARSIAV